MNNPSTFSQKMSPGSVDKCWMDVEFGVEMSRGLSAVGRSVKTLIYSRCYGIFILSFILMYSEFFNNLLGCISVSFMVLYSDCTNVFPFFSWYFNLFWCNIPAFLVLTFFVLLYPKFFTYDVVCYDVFQVLMHFKFSRVLYVLVLLLLCHRFPLTY